MGAQFLTGALGTGPREGTPDRGWAPWAWSMRAHEQSATCSARAWCIPFIGTGTPGNGSSEQCTRQGWV
jgi:hypothetical protein